MEAIQILFNIAILSALFLWVYWGTRKEFATRREMLGLVAEVKNKNDDLQSIVCTLLADISKVSARVENIPKEGNNLSPGTQIAVAIRTGATIARENIECGSRIVLEALARDGRIAPEAVNANVVEALNLGEEDYEPAKPSKLPDIIVARNQKAAEQIGDRVLADLMRGMDEKI